MHCVHAMRPKKSTDGQTDKQKQEKADLTFFNHSIVTARRVPKLQSKAHELLQTATIDLYPLSRSPVTRINPLMIEERT